MHWDGILYKSAKLLHLQHETVSSCLVNHVYQIVCGHVCVCVHASVCVDTQSIKWLALRKPSSHWNHVTTDISTGHSPTDS